MEHPLRQFRRELGLTMDALVVEVGGSKSRLSRIENWVQEPDLAFLRQLQALARRRGKTIHLEAFLVMPPRRQAEPAA